MKFYAPQIANKASSHHKPSITRSYLFLGIFIIFGYTFLLPPFAVQDEPHHFFRTVQISQGSIVGTRYNPASSGGVLPTSILNFGNEYLNWAFNPNERDGLVAIKKGFEARWGGPTTAVNYSNTVIYPPFYYLPSAVSVYITRHLGLPILWSFYIGRLCNGLLWLATCALALAICSASAVPWLVFCLCTPEIYQLFCSFSQDGGNTAGVILATAFLTRLKQDSYRSATIYAATALLAAFVMSKPPYFPFLLLPLILCYGKNSRAAFVSLAISVLTISIWCKFGMSPVIAATRTDAEVSASAQLHNLLQHPEYFFYVIWNSFKLGSYGQYGDYLARTCIATLAWGWMAEQGRWWYNLFFGTGVILAACYALKLHKITSFNEKFRLSLILLMILGGSLGATMATYLTWSPVGLNWAQGVNGRYFIPSFILLGAGCVYLNFNETEAKLAIIVERGLIYVLLPISILYFAVAVFIRFWWPI